MNAGTEIISGVSVSHEHASVADLESAAGDTQRNAVTSLLAGQQVEEAFVLQTCNRIEAYVVGREEPSARALECFFDGVPSNVAVSLDHEESLRHLMRVAAGLESVVLGEDQILGQVRDAYQDARSAGGIGPVLEDGLIKAIHVGERARSETAINEGTLSLASAAVRLATGECDLTDATGLVVGAGEMGHLAGKALAEHVDELIVANRTIPHAEHVANTVSIDARVVTLDALATPAAEARVVISATDSPDSVIDRETLADAGETFVVDIAQPRDIPPAVADLPDVTVCDLDALEAVTAETRADRRDAAGVVESMVDEEFDRLLTQYKRRRADRVISAMYESAERIKRNEFQAATSKLDLDDDQAAVVDSMADAIVSQLLSAPTKSLRDAAEGDDWSTIHTALELFDPHFGPEADDAGRSPDFTADANASDSLDAVQDEVSATVLDQTSDD